MFRTRTQRTPLYSALIGLVATLGTTIAYWRGHFDYLENRALDLRFSSRLTNSIPFSDQLLSIDIDDRSLDVVGRWPWHRDIQAALVSIPAECGARALLVDLDWSEHEEWRVSSDDDADFLADQFLSASSAPGQDAGNLLTDSRVIWPDRELQAAIFFAGNVYPAFHNYHAGHIGRHPTFTEATRQFAAGNESAADRLLAALPALPAAPAFESLKNLAKLTASLIANPTNDAATAGEIVGLSAEIAAPNYADAREAALAERLRIWFARDDGRWDQHPADIRSAVYEEITREKFRLSNRNELSDYLQLAVREVLSEHATLRPNPISRALADQVAAEVTAIAPVHFLIGRHSVLPGFVNFVPEAVDGVMRREALFERCGDIVTSQLAFAVGCRMLEVEGARIAGNARELVLTPPNRAPLRFQLDSQRRTVVPWTPDSTPQAHPAQFIPAAPIYDVWYRRQLISRNERQVRAGMRYLVTFAPFADFGPAVVYVDRVEQGNSDRHRAWLGLSRAGVAKADAELAAARPAVERLFDSLQQRGSAILENPPADLGQDDLAAIRDELTYLRALRSGNESIAAEIEPILARLRMAIDGKICLLGYAATALADFKPTPIDKSTPGVRAHLNLLNGMLVGRTVRWLSRTGNSLLCLGLGVAMSVVSAYQRRIAWIALIALLAAVVLLLGWAAFYHWTLWVAIVPALASLVLSYLAVALFQFSFVDRERRILTKTLGQYTSTTLARKMAEQPELCRRAESREVSAMFTDLAGFTTISERIGAERTQRVLNLTLGRISDDMLRHEAMINKFIGDGVFAFWNPVIYPQSDHALRACETALDLFAGLDRLIAEQRTAGGDDAFSDLILRVGVATGNAVVGPCGSEQKYDYTCIGDSVNLAARLEGANKFYGTRILVSGRTRELAGDRFAYRALGNVQVKGKKLGVPIFELLGRSGSVPQESLEYADLFARGIATFQSRDWTSARAAFTDAAARRPKDAAAQAYLHSLDLFADDPPPKDWNGSIELTEK